MNTTRLMQCYASTSLPYMIMHWEILDAYVVVGDFLVISQITGRDIIGRLIDVSYLDNVCMDKISFEDKNYLFLDNGSEERKICGLLQIWKPVESRRAGFVHLSTDDNYKLKGIP